ncbi:Pentatricopeptide repeat-containing protein [Hibiscus syriacus]|uniref:Pentatricopeptide repeat-containing protein n=1 Tax=Hibiscus syriacus TaxID=106335 RepID=A0A6A3C813_HIBSY|nr:pentatricopeptide repeat-containing protein At3g59040-like [Hibiscus syriacus]KAE8725395.1 Pentatricopeptide repeat-containing protein [Hibiscus syriacus]
MIHESDYWWMHCIQQGHKLHLASMIFNDIVSVIKSKARLNLVYGMYLSHLFELFDVGISHDDTFSFDDSTISRATMANINYIEEPEESIRCMQRAGLLLDVVSYALLINAYGKARREEEALAVFEEMLDAGIRPTHKSYNILLDAFAISGMVEQARAVFKSMRRDRYTPDICSYTTMLSAYINASDMEGAENFFTRLKQDGLRPNIVTYGTLMKGYAKVNNLEKMMETYEEMRLSGIKANQTIFTTLMDAYGKNRDFGSGVVRYKEMESYGVPPDQKAKNILLSLAKTVDEQKEANQLVGRMETKVNGFSRFLDEEDDIEEAVLHEKRGQ